MYNVVKQCFRRERFGKFSAMLHNFKSLSFQRHTVLVPGDTQFLVRHNVAKITPHHCHQQKIFYKCALQLH